MNLLDAYGMDTITMAGPLEAKLEAMKSAGFSQVMLMARDLVGHPGGVKAAVKAIQSSGLRPTGFQVLRDFEGLSGHLHSYKVDIAKSMLEMCAATGSKVLLACSSTSRHATDDLDQIAKDLKKLAMMAMPTKLCLGAAPSMNLPAVGMSSAELTVPIWASVLTRFISLQPRRPLMPSRTSTPIEFIWLNCQISCGMKRLRLKNA